MRRVLVYEGSVKGGDARLANDASECPAKLALCVSGEDQDEKDSGDRSNGRRSCFQLLHEGEEQVGRIVEV